MRRPPFEDLAEANRLYLRAAKAPDELLVIRNRRSSTAGAPVEGAKTSLLAHVLLDVGSRNTAMVELLGVYSSSTPRSRGYVA